MDARIVNADSMDSAGYLHMHAEDAHMPSCDLAYWGHAASKGEWAACGPGMVQMHHHLHQSMRAGHHYDSRLRYTHPVGRGGAQINEVVPWWTSAVPPIGAIAVGAVAVAAVAAPGLPLIRCWICARLCDLVGDVVLREGAMWLPVKHIVPQPSRICLVGMDFAMAQARYVMWALCSTGSTGSREHQQQQSFPALLHQASEERCTFITCIPGHVSAQLRGEGA